MSNKNSRLVQMAAVQENPLVFTQSATSANIDLMLNLIALEGAESTIPRGYLDEMSNPCRVTLYRMLLDLKAKI